MSKVIKYSLVFLSVVTFTVLGGLYYVSKKLSRNDIKSLLIASIQRIMPSAQVSIGDVDYNLGLSLGFEVKNFDLRLKEGRPGSGLFFTERAFVKVPMWILLFNKGEIDIIVSSPQINYYEYRDGRSNWNLKKTSKSKGWRKRKKNEKSLVKNENNLGVDLSVPSFFDEGKINIRSSDIAVFYQTNEDVKGEFSISKLLVKNIFSKNKQVIFEVQTSTTLPIGGEQLFSSNVLLVGELDAFNFLSDGVLKAKLEARLTENRLSGSNRLIPDIKSEITLSNKKKHIVADIKLNARDIVDELKAKVVFDRNKIIRFDELRADLDFPSILKIAGIDPKRFKLNKAKIHVLGVIHTIKRPQLNLRFQSSGDIEFVHLKNPVELRISGAAEGQNMTLNIPLETISGTGMISVGTIIPEDIMKISWGGLEKTKLNIELDRIKVTKRDVLQFIQSNKSLLDYKKEKLEEGPNSIVMEKKERRFIFPDVQVALFGKRFFIEDAEFKFDGRIKVKDNIIVAKDFLIGLGDGRSKIDFVGNLGRDFISGKFNMGAKNISLELLHFALSGNFKNILGTTDTNIEGTLTWDKGKFEHDVRVRSSTINGEMKGLGIGRVIEDYRREIPELKELLTKESVNISDKFKYFLIRGRFLPDHYKIDKVNFVGEDNKFTLRGKGDIFPLSKNKKGSISLVFRKKSKRARAKSKTVGPHYLPIRLKGGDRGGLSLDPDYPYTLNKIIRSHPQVIKKKKL